MYSFHHVCLSVTDRERSVAFYNQLGFAQVHLWQADDGSLTITHLKHGDMMLELFCYRDHQQAPESIRSTKTDLPVIGTKHFGMRVGSIEAARQDLAAKGIIKPDTVITEGHTGVRYIFIADPDGILVEISEDKRDFWQ
jgi:glyoxylase I family protein